MLTQNLGSLPKSRLISGLVLSCPMKTLDGVYMTDIVKICKKHGELKKENVAQGNRCVFCIREYASNYRKKYPDKVKTINAKYNSLKKEYKKNGFEYKPIRKNNKYYEGRKSIECKKHGLVEGDQLIVRENDYLRCRLCAYERNRSWEKRNPDKVKKMKRDTYLRYITKYEEESILRQKKIAKEEYYRLIEKQNNKCAICFNNETKQRKDGTLSPLCIDHCHKTGKVRGLLCNKCNRGIGFFKDNINNLKNAIDYLLNFQDEVKNDKSIKS